MISKKEIINSLEKLKINKNDIVMMHGDANVSSQLKGKNLNNKLKSTFELIIKYLKPNGTLIVPTFTTSFTKTKRFNMVKSKSEIGIFSEKFRNIKGVKRSFHPIFSFGVIGKNQKSFLNTNMEDCFGEGTFFDLLYKKNAKIICFGCGFNEITFTLFVEQYLKVNYRYFKYFKGIKTFGNKEFKTNVRYFVRDLNRKTDLNLFLLKDRMIKKNKIKTTAIGRIAIHSVKTKDYFYEIRKLLKLNKYGLIEERFNNK